MSTNAEKVLGLANRAGVLRSRDLTERGIPRATLTRLVRAGRLERVAWGVYALPGADVSEHHTLVEASQRVPHGVVCLLSALRFHDLTTQEPFEVWLAIDRKARKPKLDYPPLRIVRFSGEAASEGVDRHSIEGVTVKVTSAARTVADCFRYRNIVGIDVAIEALKEYRNTRKGTLDTLWKAAEYRRVKSVIRPYIEALV